MNRRVGTCVLIMLALGCRPKNVPAPSASIAQDSLVFDSPEHGVRLSYPATWKPAPNKDYVLQMAPPNEIDKSPPRASVSLDVPKLPPHIPGLIPLGSVVNGYVDDLKKKDPNVKIDAPMATKVAGANARRVRSTRTADGNTSIENTVLTVHGDRVYIFRANYAPDREAEMVSVLDGILGSVQWK